MIDFVRGDQRKREFYTVKAAIGAKPNTTEEEPGTGGRFFVRAALQAVFSFSAVSFP
jgi:hypothetical protein